MFGGHSFYLFILFLAPPAEKVCEALLCKIFAVFYCSVCLSSSLVCAGRGLLHRSVALIRSDVWLWERPGLLSHPISQTERESECLRETEEQSLWDCPSPASSNVHSSDQQLYTAPQTQLSAASCLAWCCVVVAVSMVSMRTMWYLLNIQKIFVILLHYSW